MVKRIFFWEKREDLCSSKDYPWTDTNIMETEIRQQGWSKNHNIIALEAYDDSSDNMTQEEAIDYLNNLERDKEKERMIDWHELD